MLSNSALKKTLCIGCAMRGKKPRLFADHSRGEFMHCHHAIQLNIVTQGMVSKGEELAKKISENKSEVEVPLHEAAGFHEEEGHIESLIK